MTTKIIIDTEDAQGKRSTECRVLYTENGAQLEKRIDTILANLKADGYKHAVLRDCFNLEYPDMFQHS